MSVILKMSVTLCVCVCVCVCKKERKKERERERAVADLGFEKGGFPLGVQRQLGRIAAHLRGSYPQIFLGKYECAEAHFSAFWGIFSQLLGHLVSKTESLPHAVSPLLVLASAGCKNRHAHLRKYYCT